MTTDRDDAAARAHARCLPAPAPCHAVDRRRAAVAEARTLPELVAAHDTPEAFLATPYGAALLAHRVDVLGLSPHEALVEIGV